MSGPPRQRDLYILGEVLGAYARRKIDTQTKVEQIRSVVPWSRGMPSRSSFYRYWGEGDAQSKAEVVATMFQDLLERHEQLDADAGGAGGLDAKTVDEALRRLEGELAASRGHLSREILRKLEQLQQPRNLSQAARHKKLAEVLRRATELTTTTDGSKEFLLVEALKSAESAGMAGREVIRAGWQNLLSTQVGAADQAPADRAAGWKLFLGAWPPAPAPQGQVRATALGFLRHHLETGLEAGAAMQATAQELANGGAVGVDVHALYPQAVEILLELDRAQEAMAALPQCNLDEADVETLIRLAAHLGRAVYVQPDLPQQPWQTLRNAVTDVEERASGEIGALEIGWVDCLQNPSNENVPRALIRYWVEALVDEPWGAWSAVQAAEVLVHAWRERGRTEAAVEVARDVLRRCTHATSLTPEERRTMEAFRALVEKQPTAAGPVDEVVDRLYDVLAERTAPVHPRTRERLRRITQLLAED